MKNTADYSEAALENLIGCGHEIIYFHFKTLLFVLRVMYKIIVLYKWVLE